MYLSSICKCLQEKYQRMYFYSPLKVLLFPVSAVLSILLCVMVRVPPSRGILLIHTNDCPLFDVIENACTFCWKEWKKVNMGNQKWRINWVEMELLLLGKENIVLIEPLNCFGGRRAHVLGLYQRILNSYINYWGNIAQNRTAWFSLSWMLFA